MSDVGLMMSDVKAENSVDQNTGAIPAREVLHQTSHIRHQSSPPYRPWLFRYAVALVVLTFGLVALGGNVTSRDAGLSVPDGFTVFGHFLWSFPVDQWVGNIFHEHVHRLKGSVVGLMCIALVIWVLRVEKRRSIRWMSIGILAGVVLQGIMGGLRVEMVTRWPSIATPLAITHGVTGQLFLCLTVAFAVMVSRRWLGQPADDTPASPVEKHLRRASLALLAVLLVQLVLGSITRHTGAGLAIPDFPSSYGGLAPPMSQEAITAAIDQMPYDQVTGYYTAGQVHVHFAHRAWAVVVLLMSGYLLARLNTVVGGARHLLPSMTALGGLLVLQLALGALVIWTGRQPDIATGHQSVGAAIFAVATLLAMLVGRSRLAPEATPSTHSTEPKRELQWEVAQA